MVNNLPSGARLVVGLMRGDKRTLKQGYTFANALYAADQQRARTTVEATSSEIEIEGAILAALSAQALVEEHVVEFGTCRCGAFVRTIGAYRDHLIDDVFRP